MYCQEEIFSSLLVRNDTTQLGASFIVDVYLLLRF